MDRPKIIHQVRRLAIASDSFQQCLALVAHMRRSNLDIFDDLYPPMIAGVVVTYAKNFNQADGLGPLPGLFTKFPEASLETAHARLIKARNELYAHRDVSAHRMKGNDGVMVEYPVHVRINDDNNAFLFEPHLIDIPPKRLPDIEQLLQFQMTRLQDDLDGKLALVVDFDKDYKQGVTYVLGKDFP